MLHGHLIQFLPDRELQAVILRLHHRRRHNIPGMKNIFQTIQPCPCHLTDMQNTLPVVLRVHDRDESQRGFKIMHQLHPYIHDSPHGRPLFMNHALSQFIRKVSEDTSPRLSRSHQPFLETQLFLTVPEFQSNTVNLHQRVKL